VTTTVIVDHERACFFGSTRAEFGSSRPEWKQAAVLTGFSQYSPADGIAAEDSIEVLVWYSVTAINFGVLRCDLAKGDAHGVRRTSPRPSHVAPHQIAPHASPVAVFQRLTCHSAPSIASAASYGCVCFTVVIVSDDGYCAEWCTTLWATTGFVSS